MAIRNIRIIGDEMLRKEMQTGDRDEATYQRTDRRYVRYDV